MHPDRAVLLLEDWVLGENGIEEEENERGLHESKGLSCGKKFPYTKKLVNTETLL